MVRISHKQLKLLLKNIKIKINIFYGLINSRNYIIVYF